MVDQINNQVPSEPYLAADYPARVEKREDVIKVSRTTARRFSHNFRRAFITDDARDKPIEHANLIKDHFMLNDIVALSNGDKARDDLLKLRVQPTAPRQELFDGINAQATLFSFIHGMDLLWGTKHAQQVDIAPEALDISQTVLLKSPLPANLENLPQEVAYWVGAFSDSRINGRITEVAYFRALAYAMGCELIEKKIPGMISESNKRMPVGRIAKATPLLVGLHDISMPGTPQIDDVERILRNNSILNPNYLPLIISMSTGSGLSISRLAAKGIPISPQSMMQKNLTLGKVLIPRIAALPNQNMDEVVYQELREFELEQKKKAAEAENGETPEEAES